jgi:uncharacterized repeat protein (TIGR03803 family)
LRSAPERRKLVSTRKDINQEQAQNRSNLMKNGIAGRLFAVTLFFLSVLTTSNAQPTFTTLYNINGTADGFYPQAGLISSGNRLYGTALSAGSFGYGMVFGINADGTGFTNLYSFTGLPYWLSGTNTDGAYPFSDLVLLGDSLYGTAWIGGYFDYGTVFKVNTNGTSFENLYNFSGGSDGAYPYAGFVLAGNTLYGTTSGGGSSGNGTVFAINTDGTSFTNLYSFTALDPVTLTNTDGANPHARLVLAGTALYGTAPNGGRSGFGTVFRINVDGTGFTNLYSFTALDPVTQTNTDGAYPYAGLILSGNTLYGTAYQGGSSGHGTIFKINTDGTGFTNLYSFTPSTEESYLPINSDGAYPYAGLIISGNTLYGTAREGGDTGFGTVFAVSTDGTSFTNLHSFTDANFLNYDGGWPMARLCVVGSTLYGTAATAGNSWYGTVFALSLVPSLGIQIMGCRSVRTCPLGSGAI